MEYEYGQERKNGKPLSALLTASERFAALRSIPNQILSIKPPYFGKVLILAGGSNDVNFSETEPHAPLRTLLPAAVAAHERHFASLGGCLDATDPRTTRDSNFERPTSMQAE